MTAVTARTARFGLYLADLRRSRNDSHGIVNYGLGLARSLPAQLGPGEELVVYVNDELARELEGSDRPSVVHRVVPAPVSASQRLAMDHRHVRRWARDDDLACLHFPKGHVPIAGVDGVPVVASVHDTISVAYARTTSSLTKAGIKHRYFALATRFALRRAHCVVTDTNASAEALRSLDPRMRPHRVIAPGVDCAMAADGRQQKADVLLHFGSPFAHKRSRDAVRWGIDYIRRVAPSLQLVVIGRLAPELAVHVVQSGGRMAGEGLPPADVQRWLSRSRALLFTSEHEGFGLPPVEATVAGTPAVWARSPAVREVMDGAPGGYDVGNRAQFEAALDDVLALDEQALQALRRDFAQRYSWPSAAAAMLDVYRDAAAAGSGDR